MSKVQAFNFRGQEAYPTSQRLSCLFKLFVAKKTAKGHLLGNETLVSNAFPVMVGSLEHSQLLIEKLQSENDDIGISSTIHVANAIRVFGQTYKTGTVVPLNYELRGK
ncbi:hypothetical protein CRENBAI_023660 [Crenichthys baileyi]|uniref:Uncharacterized protein n=1 Tax=Crenichthys baileyi TaxID=28760 RepID=A0AAV9RPM1_9TELE